MATNKEKEVQQPQTDKHGASVSTDPVNTGPKTIDEVSPSAQPSQTQGDEASTKAAQPTPEQIAEAEALERARLSAAGVSTRPDPNRHRDGPGWPPEGTRFTEGLREEQEYDGRFVAMPVFLVEAKAGLDTVAHQVFEHEIPILHAKYPDGVKVVDDEFAMLDIPDDAHIEFLRMKRKHATPRHQDIIERIVSTPENLARVTGLSLGYAVDPSTESKARIKATKPATKGVPQSTRKAARRTAQARGR